MLATALKGLSDRQTTAAQDFHRQVETLKAQELADIRQDLKNISAQIHQQGTALEAVAKKKGFSF